MNEIEHDRAYGFLKDILEAQHDQLKFAESKNAALLAASLASVAGIGAIAATNSNLPHSVSAWLFVTAIGLACGGLISLSSFWAIAGGSRHTYASGSDGGGSNLVYWEEIAKFRPTAYLQAVLEALGLRGGGEKLLGDMANQIVIVAAIAGRKFYRFNVAAAVTSVAAIAPAMFLGFSWLQLGFKFA